MPQLDGKRIAIVATDGFEEAELFDPMARVKAQGAQVEVLSLKAGEVKGFKHLDPGKPVTADKAISDAQADDYDGLILPGGTVNADTLRVDSDAQAFVKHFFDTQKPVAAICHAPWLLINADVVKGRTLTSFHTLQRDLENAGATWVDQEVVVDGSLVTSRKPDDIPAFNAKLTELFAKAGQTA